MATGTSAAAPSASVRVPRTPACAPTPHHAPQDQATGYRLGQTMGAWQIRMQRPGVAEFWTMKTRKEMEAVSDA